MDDYKRGGHSKHSMKVHLIFVTKYRRKTFDIRHMKDDIKQFLYDATKGQPFGVLQMETDKDHVHMLIEYNPTISVSVMVKHLKQYSIYQMWRHHGEYLSGVYWKRKVLWSDGYFACSIGQVSQQTIERYISNQE